MPRTLHRRWTQAAQKVARESNTEDSAGPFYFLLRGALEFGAWIDERGGAGYTEGQTIECPPYVIEDILRRQLSQTTETIDYEGFDTSGNTTNGLIKDWKFFRDLIS